MRDTFLSIYIPTYNRADKVVKQLFFLINEIKEIDTNKIEIIVNDNCSTDETREKVLACIKDTQIIYHRNERNLGIDGNMYAAAEFATGRYLWTLGDDDVLLPGIVKRVYDILHSDPEISYLFLNYASLSDSSNLAYDGPSGLIDDAATLMTNQKKNLVHALFLSSASIYSTKAFLRCTQKISLESEEHYGINGCVSLACLKMGKSFFESKLWLYNDPNNMSWKDIVYDSNMGSLRMFRKLNLFGYNKREISAIYKSWINGALVAGMILHRLVLKKDLKRYLKDTAFCFLHAPINVITIYGDLLERNIKKCLHSRS